LLTKDDFKVTGNDLNETAVIDDLENDTLLSFYFFNPDKDENRESVIITPRGISLGSSKQDVIDKYGMGSLVFFDMKTDLLYRALGSTYDEYIKDAKYSIQYRTEDKLGWRMCFYFDDNDEVILIMYTSSDYSSIAKYIDD